MSNEPTTVERPYIRPSVSIRESATDVVIEAEMPGLVRENIGIALTGDDLVISGSRADCAVPEGYIVAFRDRHCADYRRSFTLNVPVDRDRIDAQYTDGVLKLTLPKSPEALPKKIQIK